MQPKKKESSPDYDYSMKVIIIGDSGVGKSSLLYRYRENKFIDNYIMTIGINYVWTISEVDDLKIKLQIWDTAGQQKYKTITQNYYRNSNGAIISYSIDCRDSFESVSNFIHKSGHWIDELNQSVRQNTQILLIGTKNDLIEQRQVAYEEAEQFAKQYDIPYLQCSAKSGQSVHEVFHKLSRMMKEKFIDDKLKQEDPIYPHLPKQGGDGVIHLLKFPKNFHNKCCQ